MKYRNIVNYKYQLMEAEEFKVDMPDTNESLIFVTIQHGVLYIDKYYAWDGSSVPMKGLWSWIWNSDRYCKRASLVHDALCQLIRAGLVPLSYRQAADELYRVRCIEDGMSKWQAKMRYWALRKFGSKTVEKPKNPIIRYKHGKNK